MTKRDLLQPNGTSLYRKNMDIFVSSISQPHFLCFPFLSFKLYLLKKVDLSMRICKPHMHPLQVSYLWPDYLKRQKKHHQGGK